MAIKPDPMDVPGVGPPPDFDERRVPQQRHLQYITSLESPELLEDAVTIGLRALEDLKQPLEVVAVLDITQASKWVKLIDDLKSRAKPTRTIVGVVGNTGAGKSSIISAVLDEERLLPTNCMRACTASPTEISYNYSDDPDELYRAEVEFLTAEDWKKELDSLYVDLLDSNGEVSRDCANPDSEAGIAYAKIKAVYPKKTKEMISRTSTHELVSEPAVRGVLGAVKSLKAATSSSIYGQLQEFVDSKEKNSVKAMEYWPLIKVVRIFTKAKALATGACLVDLPGIQDSNAARAAVASNYMKACTGLWIVAPINRAVDDKTAKSLLGDSFRRQLKYDGTYSAVTFICSKTDDISITEAADSLQLEELLTESFDKVNSNKDEIRELKSKLANLKAEKELLEDEIESIEKEWETWEKLGKKISKGKSVYAPSAKSPRNKRKRKAKPRGARKNRRSADSDYDSEDDLSDFEMLDGSDKENSQSHDEVPQPLTEEDVEEKLVELKANKRKFRASKKAKEEQMSPIRVQIKQLQAEKEALSGEIRAACIRGRNEYSRQAIKMDFAMGIKELDQETAAEEDEANFDPEVDLRDYDAVAQYLPVFCVSTRAFQQLSGRLQKDGINSSGFPDINDTEVPQLQAHARQLTESSRIANCRRFLNELMHLVNSMKMWATNVGSQSELNDFDRQSEEVRLRGLLQHVGQELAATAHECSQKTKKALSENIFEYFDKSIPYAVEAALPTATGWGMPKTVGGLIWTTYKATCKRFGVFTGSLGSRDFNAELFDPISKNLASGWERAFQRRLPSCLDKFARNVKSVIEAFHHEAIRVTQERGSNIEGVNMLNVQLRTLLQHISDLPASILQLCQEMQRDTNRCFTPEIQKAMNEAYEKCTAESGPGSFARMKDLMATHVETNRRSMFRDATNVVQGQLEDLNTRIEGQLLIHMQETHGRLSHDYLAALIGTAAIDNDNSGVPRAERMLRAEMIPLLEGVDPQFADLLAQLNEAFNDDKADLLAQFKDTFNHDEGLDGAPVISPEPFSGSENSTYHEVELAIKAEPL